MVILPRNFIIFCESEKYLRFTLSFRNGPQKVVAFFCVILNMGVHFQNFVLLVHSFILCSHPSRDQVTVYASIQIAYLWY